MAYIDREKLIDVLRNNFRPPIFTASFLDLFSRYVEHEIMRQPTADVAEVKHGEWRLHPDGSGTCEVCGRHQKSVWDMDTWQKYCGHCGAKMDGGNAE